MQIFSSDKRIKRDAKVKNASLLHRFVKRAKSKIYYKIAININVNIDSIDDVLLIDIIHI